MLTARFEIELNIESDLPRRVDRLAVTLYDRYGTKLVNADTLEIGETIWLDRQATVLLQMKELHLKPGTYILGLYLAAGAATFDQADDVVEIEVTDPPFGTVRGHPKHDGTVTCDFWVSTNRKGE